MTEEKIKKRISSLCSHFTFEYNGHQCGVDPISAAEYEMWCGETTMTASSVDEVMQTPFFDGTALSEISDKIEIIDW